MSANGDANDAIKKIFSRSFMSANGDANDAIKKIFRTH
jgi:hypothetical protein